MSINFISLSIIFIMKLLYYSNYGIIYLVDKKRKGALIWQKII